MNFRRHLKNWRKEINRQRTIDSFKNLRAILNQIGVEVTSVSDLDEVLRCGKAQGRHFTRLGKAARKQGKLVFMRDIADYTEHELDLREIPFYTISSCRTLYPDGKHSIAEGTRMLRRAVNGIPSYPLKNNESSKTKKIQVAAV